MEYNNYWNSNWPQVQAARHSNYCFLLISISKWDFLCGRIYPLTLLNSTCCCHQRHMVYVPWMWCMYVPYISLSVNVWTKTEREFNQQSSVSIAFPSVVGTAHQRTSSSHPSSIQVLLFDFLSNFACISACPGACSSIFFCSHIIIACSQESCVLISIHLSCLPRSSLVVLLTTPKTQGANLGHILHAVDTWQTQKITICSFRFVRDFLSNLRQASLCFGI